jgi:hypothetical protein
MPPNTELHNKLNMHGSTANSAKTKHEDAHNGGAHIKCRCNMRSSVRVSIHRAELFILSLRVTGYTFWW